MHAETCGIHMVGDGSYFDITHSFKIGLSTYHILGLRKNYPTYGNNYYIFNCTAESSPSESLPYIRSARSSEHRGPRTTVTEIRKKTSSKHEVSHSHTTLQTKMESDITVIKKALTEIMQSEHQSLVTSLREERKADKQLLLRSIEKEKDVFTQGVSTVNNEKQTIVHLLEEHNTSLQSTYERHVSTTISSIELLKKSIIETINAQYERLQVLDQFQLTLTEIIEREVEKTMVKHLETYRSTSIDVTTIQQIQSTLIEAFDKCYITTRNNNDNELKQFFAEQYQYLTDLLKKQQETILRELTTMKQSQSVVVETKKKFSTTTSESSEYEALKQLFIEQRQYFTDLIGKQSQTLPLALIKETVLDVIKEQTSISAGPTMATIPVDVEHDHRSFKVAIQTEEFAHIYAELAVGGKKYDRELYTLCQRDPSQANVVNCFVAPPLKNGTLGLTIYAKTKSESEYRAAISFQMSVQKMTQGSTFPQLFPSFQDHQCILIEPFQRLIQLNEQILIHMVLPGARKVKIRNGDNDIVLGQDEFRNGIVKTKVQVRGDLIVYGQWNGRTDLAVCAFEMDNNALD